MSTSLYGWMWHKLPGTKAVKALIAFLVTAVVVVVLFAWVFPWLEPRLPWVDVTVGDPSAAG